jgi:hypothetical protein
VTLCVAWVHWMSPAQIPLDAVAHSASCGFLVGVGDDAPLALMMGQGGVALLSMTIELKPGFASAEVVDESESTPGSVGSGFEGLTEAQCSALWAREHLCLRCVHAHLCKWCTGEDVPVVIGKCMAFAPE